MIMRFMTSMITMKLPGFWNDVSKKRNMYVYRDQELFLKNNFVQYATLYEIPFEISI